MKKLKKILYSCYLCLKFSFLYPRNRFTDKPRKNVLCKQLWKLRQKAIREISITGKLETESKHFWPRLNFLNYNAKLDKSSKKLILSNGLDTKEHDLKSLLWSDNLFEILGLTVEFAMTGTPIVIVHVKTKDETDKSNYGFSYEKEELTLNKWYKFWYNFTLKLDDLFDKILIIPTHTELDSMPEGWRKAFGLQMCQEIKDAILKSGGKKYLKSYRIMQIKEKWGGLCWYDNGQTPEVRQVIEKYEQLSYNTCIDCGKPATKMTGGWICPYCDDCFPKSYIVYMERNNGPWKMTKEWEDRQKELEDKDGNI